MAAVLHPFLPVPAARRSGRLGKVPDFCLAKRAALPGASETLLSRGRAGGSPAGVTAGRPLSSRERSGILHPGRRKAAMPAPPRTAILPKASSMATAQRPARRISSAGAWDGGTPDVQITRPRSQA